MSHDTDEYLKILKYPDPRLRRKCPPVTDFDDKLRELAEAMLELMKSNNGVGLAGPQVGFMRRIFVCNHSAEPGDDLVVVNPELQEMEGLAETDEGCLSIPEVLVPIRRAQRCTMIAKDVTGRTFEVTAEDLQARIWIHENDHLDGKLILDYMNEAGRIANRRAIKHLEETFTK